MLNVKPGDEVMVLAVFEALKPLMSSGVKK